MTKFHIHAHLLADTFHTDSQGYLITHAAEHEIHTPRAALDIENRFETLPIIAPWVFAAAGALGRYGNGAALPEERQIPLHFIAVVAQCLDGRTLEGDRGVFLNVEKIGAA